MPIEIRELVIKATVEQEGGSATSGNTSTASANNSVSPNEEMIKMCVEKVLEILKEKDGR
jgi:hypothetical protein